MYWTNIVVEGHCLGDEDNDGKAPCGRIVPSTFCLGDGNHCPHFACSVSSERETAKFVPFYLVLKDRLESWCYTACDNIRWWFWDRLWFNRRKVDEFFTSIEVIDEDSPVAKECKREDQKAQRKFEKWIVRR